MSSPTDLYYLIYASAASRRMNEEDLVELLRQARENNQKANITGLLLYRNGNFMQLLEGPERNVKQLIRHIERDPRHYGLMVLSEGALDRRRFDQWEMAFKHLSNESILKEPGYSSFLETLPTPEEAEAQADRLLLLLDTFKEEFV
ncbi:MAG: BLUF domain-containing protein [Ardenticatenales bacterium]|nr:BLUF domain-containing protein [Ardenticatenales bacterium]